VAQSFRHVLRGVDAAEVESYALEHQQPWWKPRQVSVKVRDGRIRASRVPGGLDTPPVLHGTVSPGPDGTVIEGTLTRGARRVVSAVYWFAAALMAVVAVGVLVGGAPLWLALALAAAAVAFVAVERSISRLRRDGDLEQVEADELRGELDVFFGVRERR
jgi:Flp pilus assembly protein TadB